MFENPWYDKVWELFEQRRKYPCRIQFIEWLRARRNFATYENRKKKRFRISFEEYIGAPKHEVLNIVADWRYNNWRDYCYNVTEEHYEIIQRCNSPHFVALLTADWIKRYNTRKRHG